jgi:hypothetical protein
MWEKFKELNPKVKWAVVVAVVVIVAVAAIWGSPSPDVSSL